MGRTKGFNTGEALEAAMRVFWKNGYEATSMENLEEAMKLKRTSIYNAFGNKRQLYKAVLDRYLNTVLSRFTAAFKQADSAKGAVEAVFRTTVDHHFNFDNPGGCLVVLSVLENHQHDESTRRMLEDILQGLSHAVMERLKQGVLEGELKPDTPVRRIGDQVTAMVNGITVMVKAHFPETHLRELAEASADMLLKPYIVGSKG